MSPPARLGLRGFLRALVRARPRRLAWVIVVQVGAGLGQAIGVLLLIPLLAAVGVGGSTGVTGSVRGVLEDIGVRPTLGAVLAIYVAVIAASAALTAYQGVLSARYRLEFVDETRERLYGAVARAEWQHLIELRHSDLLAVLTTNVAWVGIGAAAVLSLAATGIIAVAQLAAAVRISPVMTALAAGSSLVLMLVVWPLARRSRRLGAQLVERNRGVLAVTTGFLEGLKLTKAYGHERRHMDEFSEAIAQARGSQIAFAQASALASAIQTILTAALLAVTVYVAVRVVKVPLSSLLAVTFVFTRLAAQTAAAQTSILQLAQALPAFDEVTTLTARSEGAEEAPASRARDRLPIGTGVRVQDVEFAYPGRGGRGPSALCGVSLEVPTGSITALAGGSGAGKTTLADLVAGLLLPSAGEVRVGGVRLTAERLAAWRRSVALVPQEPFLFHDTIEANLRWARPNVSDDELWDALRLAAAAEFTRRLPDGLHTVVGDRGGRLSGGERQRLALARALLRAPELLILDEATSSLDAANRDAIWTAVGSLRGHTTVLMISHEDAMLERADRVVVLDAGRVLRAYATAPGARGAIISR
jgi:ATP-binding cassette, subfamily C, bacterial